MQQLDPEILSLARTRRGPYLAAISAPGDRRAALLTLLALDAELARIPQLVSEPMLGRIRLQWWLEALPGVAGNQPQSHPVAQALAPLGLDLQTLHGFVEAHGFAFDDDTATVDEHQRHADASGGALACLMMDGLGITDPEPRAAASAIGAAWRLVEALQSGRRVASNADAEALRAHARTLVKQARAVPLSGAQRRAAMGVLGLARLVEAGLNQPLAPLGAGAVLKVWWASITGRF